MEIADDLGNCAFNAEKFISEKIVNLERLVFVQPFGARIIRIVDTTQPARLLFSYSIFESFRFSLLFREKTYMTHSQAFQR
jgi:hypothetical protein